MTPTKNKSIHVADELGKVHHLATAESRGKPLCGESSPDAAIGSYVEHLDERGEFIVEVIGKDRKPATACQQCLSLYPTLSKLSRDDRALQRITPFNLLINVALTPNISLSGYDINAHGIAAIDDKRVGVRVLPGLTFTSARWLYGLYFDMSVDAPLIVPLVNKANKDC